MDLQEATQNLIDEALEVEAPAYLDETEYPIRYGLVQDPEKRQERARELTKRWSAWQDHIASLTDRWEANEKLIRNDPENPTDAFWAGYVYRHIPVTSAKAGAWQAYVCSSPTEASPYLVGTIFGQDATRASEIEQDFYLFMRKVHWDRTFRKNIRNVGIYGKAIWRLRPYYENDKPCFEFKAIRPRSFFVYPNNDCEIPELLTLGHVFTMRVGEIQDKRESKEFYEGSVPTPTSDAIPKPSAPGLVDNEDIAIEDRDKAVNVIECMDRFDYGQGERWYRVQFDPGANPDILGVYEYKLSRPWYFDQWVHEEQEGFWPETSKLNDIQGLQLATNEQWNLMSAGSQMNAFPSTYASGWALPQKYAKNRPGAVTPLMTGGQVFTIQSRYDPSTSPMLLSDLDKRADEMMRISAQAQGGEASYDKTATGAQIRKLATDVAINDDLAQLDICCSQMAEFMQEIYREYYPQFLLAYGDALAVQDPSLLDDLILWELNGKSPANTPQAQADAAMGLMQALVGFTPDVIQILTLAGINWQELIQTLVKNSTLDNKQKLILPQNGNSIAPPGLPGLPLGMDGNPGMAMVPGAMPPQVSSNLANGQGYVAQ